MQCAGSFLQGLILRGCARSITVLLTAVFMHGTLGVAIGQNHQNQHNLLLKSTSRQGLVQMQQACRMWSQQSLRSTIQEIASRYAVPIWIDRRIDPNQILDLSQSTQQSTLGDELDRLALSCGASSGLVENVYLIAPADRVARIQKAAIVLHGQLSAAGAGIASAQKSLEWPDIATPNELLEVIRQTWNVSISQELPHDLLYAGSLPECSLATQLALILGGFDLQATLIDGVRGQHSDQWSLGVRQLSNSTNWQDSYSRSFNDEILAGLVAGFPGSKVEKQASGRLLVHGPTNLHNELLAMGMATGRNRNSNANGRQQVYSFNIEAKLPVQAVLENLAKTLQFDLEWSDQCSTADRHRLIQLKVENVTRRQLLEQVCQEAQLSLEEREKKVIIHPGNLVP